MSSNGKASCLVCVRNPFILNNLPREDEAVKYWKGKVSSLYRYPIDFNNLPKQGETVKSWKGKLSSLCRKSFYV